MHYNKNRMKLSTDGWLVFLELGSITKLLFKMVPQLPLSINSEGYAVGVGNTASQNHTSSGSDGLGLYTENSLTENLAPSVIDRSPDIVCIYYWPPNMNRI